MSRPSLVALLVLLICCGFSIGVIGGCDTKPGEADEIKDEASAAEIKSAYFVPESDDQIHDYFPGMDVVSVAGPPAAPTDVAWPDALLDKYIGPTSRPARGLADPLADAAHSKSEILGRNTWMLWCGGNEAFWDSLASNSRGTTDLLKLIDSRQRSTRWATAGMVNEPGMRQAATPGTYGLWIDVPEDAGQTTVQQQFVTDAFDAFKSHADVSDRTRRVGNRLKDLAAKDRYKRPFAYDSTTRPAYGPAPRPVPPPTVYGISSGVVGLRLFPNPDFDDAAAKAWDPERYYNDREYYTDPKLIRPFRVGMSCAFCHASAHPLNPPQSPASPKWENISGSIGSQYLRIRAVFGNILEKNDFVYHLLDSQPPGTIDTSLIATDNVNNTNTMNAIFGVPQRVLRSFENPAEAQSATAATMPSLYGGRAANDPVPEKYKNLIDPAKLQDHTLPDGRVMRYVPHILLDGADSIGAYGALARVYLNIGTFPEKWNRLHEPLVGFVPPKDNTPEQTAANRVQLPFKVEDCAKHSVYWQATQLRVPALRDYFLRITPTMPLLDARDNRRPDPTTRPHVQVTKLAEGRRVFAQNCIVCHSSVQPETPAKVWLGDKRPKDVDQHGDLAKRRASLIKQWEVSGEAYDHDPGQWLRDPAYQAWARWAVEQPEFWQNNYLSTDMRVPVTYVNTNSARAVATNAMDGHMWEDFSSKTFRTLPSVGAIHYFNPYTQKEETYEAQSHAGKHLSATQPKPDPHGGGPGYYRPASLMSVWATAPLLHNNSLGVFNNDPSVKGRLEAFEDAIHKMLDPAKRLASNDYPSTAEQRRHDRGLIWRTPTETYLQLNGRDLPQYLHRIPFTDLLLSWSESLTAMGRLRAVLPVTLLVVAIGILMYARGGTSRIRLLRFGAYGIGLFAIAVGLLAYLDTGGFGGLKLGPIPAGTPVDLLANIDPEADQDKIKDALRVTFEGLSEINTRQLNAEDAGRVYREKIVPALMSVSKCPDWVMDKGHYFPWFNDLTENDKAALIELLKTL